MHCIRSFQVHARDADTWAQEREHLRTHARQLTEQAARVQEQACVVRRLCASRITEVCCDGNAQNLIIHCWVLVSRCRVLARHRLCRSSDFIVAIDSVRSSRQQAAERERALRGQMDRMQAEHAQTMQQV